MKRIGCLLYFAAVWSLAGASPAQPAPQWGGELRFCVRADPKTLDPLQAADQPGETVRYLTGGVLLRLNRTTQALEPELAESWRIAAGGRSIEFRIRQGVKFPMGPLLRRRMWFTL
jgi:peptide/nickel transport system substrate-binding protein